MRTMIRPLLMVSLLFSAANAAAEPAIFVSSFAPEAKGGAIQAFALDAETGALSPLEKTTGIENPFFMALSPNGKFLHAIHAVSFGGDDLDEEVAAYAIENSRGALRLLNRQSARGSVSCYLSVDATAKTLLVSNYGGGSVASLPIRADGSLGEAVSFFQHEGKSVDPKRQDGPYAHSIVISPDNRHAHAADLGIDKIMSYRLDAATATLTPNDPPGAALPAGSGPRHLTFHPKGKHLYAINELANTVAVFDYDAATGGLTEKQIISTLPADFDGKSHCADLKISPDGRFLFGTNRGHDSLARYRIADDGTLTLLGIDPSLGKGPQNLLVTPDGRHLLCANMAGDNVAVFRIDGESGALTPAGEPVAAVKPSCILWCP
ncbi:MAG: lactonase family protein [Verrucomicrobiae bacterium]|nr:lactonase family protein [Verrucomicrobiae bacterium]